MTPQLGSRIRVVREGVVTSVWDGGYDFDTDDGGNFTVSDRFPATVETLSPPPPEFTDGDIVAEDQFGVTVIRIRHDGKWWFASGASAIRQSFMSDVVMAKLLDQSPNVWVVDTTKPGDAEPPAPDTDDEGHEVGKTYTNLFGAAFTLRADHRWQCVDTATVHANSFPTRPLTLVAS